MAKPWYQILHLLPWRPAFVQLPNRQSTIPCGTLAAFPRVREREKEKREERSSEMDRDSFIRDLLLRAEAGSHEDQRQKRQKTEKPKRYRKRKRRTDSPYANPVRGIRRQA